MDHPVVGCTFPRLAFRDPVPTIQSARQCEPSFIRHRECSRRDGQRERKRRERDRRTDRQRGSEKRREGERHETSEIPTERENDRARGEGKRAGRQCQAARGVGVASRRGSGGGGKRVNRESTCKQATRETNNVGAAGCSPYEAGRLVRFVAVRSVSRPRQSVARHRIAACSTYRIARARAANRTVAGERL